MQSIQFTDCLHFRTRHAWELCNAQYSRYTAYTFFVYVNKILMETQRESGYFSVCQE